METASSLLPVTEESDQQKNKVAKEEGNNSDLASEALAYTSSRRSEFFTSSEAIKAFLKDKWEKEVDYRFKKELWCFMDNRIAVRYHASQSSKN